MASGQRGRPSNLRKKLHRDQFEALAAIWPSFLSTLIPAARAIERMGIERGPVATFAPRTAAALAYHAPWAELTERLWPNR
jgi:hypothetical protein